MNTTSQPLEEYRSDAWRAQRLPYVTASNAAVMFGRHPYVTPGEYWTEKVTRRVDESEMSEAMERGHVLEEPIARWWTVRENELIVKPDVLYVWGPLAATLDYLTLAGEPVEIKTTSRDTPEPLPYWIAQIQAQIGCCDAEQGWLVWFDGNVLRSELVDRDDAFLAELYDRAEQFLAAVETGMEPDWIELDAANIIALHPTPAGVRELSDAELDVVARWHDVKLAAKADDAELAELKDEMARLFGDAETLVYDGVPVATWKARKGSTYFDRKAFERDHPDIDLSAYDKRRAPTRVMKEA